MFGGANLLYSWVIFHVNFPSSQTCEELDIAWFLEATRLTLLQWLQRFDGTQRCSAVCFAYGGSYKPPNLGSHPTWGPRRAIYSEATATFISVLLLAHIAAALRWHVVALGLKLDQPKHQDLVRIWWLKKGLRPGTVLTLESLYIGVVCRGHSYKEYLRIHVSKHDLHSPPKASKCWQYLLTWIVWIVWALY